MERSRSLCIWEHFEYVSCIILCKITSLILFLVQSSLSSWWPFVLVQMETAISIKSCKCGAIGCVCIPSLDVVVVGPYLLPIGMAYCSLVPCSYCSPLSSLSWSQYKPDMAPPTTSHIVAVLTILFSLPSLSASIWRGGLDCLPCDLCTLVSYALPYLPSHLHCV